MIIVGYQGIGKSTYYSQSERKVVDLESSCFRKDDGSRADEWYNMYAKLALHLSSKGFIVFTSSHEEVRDAIKKYNESLYNNSEIIIAIVPAYDLKEAWIKRLKNRYELDKSDKNLHAYKNAEYCYEDNIKEITESIGKEKTYYIYDIDFDCIKYFDDRIDAFI